MSWNIKVIGKGPAVAAAVNKLDGMPQRLKDVIRDFTQPGENSPNSSEFNQGVILESCGHFAPEDPWSNFSVKLDRCQLAAESDPGVTPAKQQESEPEPGTDQAPTTEPRAVAPTPPPTPQAPPTPPAATQPNLQPANIQPR